MYPLKTLSKRTSFILSENAPAVTQYNPFISKLGPIFSVEIYIEG